MCNIDNTDEDDCPEYTTICGDQRVKFEHGVGVVGVGIIFCVRKKFSEIKRLLLTNSHVN